MSSLGRVVSVLRSGTYVLRQAGTKSGLRSAGSDSHVGPSYRQMPCVAKKPIFQAELLSGFMWFWILWHFWHTPEAVFGHFPYPDPSQWTDEELGIPRMRNKQGFF
ncbi:NADH dehydrogenase [ubiquinone] 1 beta subcomplex subunit 2, mitochondrial [Protopterus annectens]|uniref:NADH dehydrogenase [ubiquinone] 1 beta subcomplex subunit 2, mitochondrial n=1 Tax=Protopterus annectens TaxID=7888 RepID=UPI001CFB1D0E|nr:NADH dehydrogenase [ubiquinone] 1 beta subcomplex subunit 2, mitochondrial [Protopterus annectens]